MSRFLPRFLPGPQTTALPQATQQKDDPVVLRASGGANYVPWGQPVTNPWSLDRTVRDGFEKVPWMWRSVDAIASRAARLRLRAITGETSDPNNINFVDEREKELLHLLNVRAAPQIKGGPGSAVSFRYRLSTQLQMSKAGVYVEVVRTKGGGIYSLSLLPPQWTLPIPDPDILVGGYQVWVPGAPRYVLPAFDAESSESNSVIWVCKPHPTNPFSGTVAVEAGSMSLDQDWWARLYNRNFLMNDGRPGGVLAISGSLEEGAIDELKTRFSGGPGAAGRTSVFEADDVTWIDTAITPRDAQYNQTRLNTKEEILEGVHGVPETILGKAAERTYSNADAEREVFWTETMPDHLDMIERAFDALTTGGEDDDVRLWHDTSGIEVLARAFETKCATAMTEFLNGLITIDEYRELTGREPFNVPGSRVVFVAGSKAPIGDDSDTKAAQKLTVLPISSSQQASQNNQAVSPPGAPQVLPAARPARPQLAIAPTPAVIAGTKVFQNPPDSNGAMVAFGLDDASVETLSSYVDDPDVLHLTLVYLGKADDYALEKREQILETVDSALDGMATFTATIAAVTTFPAGPDGVPQIALLDSAEVTKARKDLVTGLDGIGVSQQSQHSFKPHVCLRYLAEGAPVPDASELVGQVITFSTVILAFGTQVDERPLDEEDTEVKASYAWA